MRKRTWIAPGVSVASIVWIACIAGCGRQPAPPSAGAPADPATTSSPTAPASDSRGAPPAPRGAPPAPRGAPPADELCDVAECGPPMRMPVRRCPDGSIGGPTDRCLRKPDGACAWEVRPCPPG